MSIQLTSSTGHVTLTPTQARCSRLLDFLLNDTHYDKQETLCVDLPMSISTKLLNVLKEYILFYENDKWCQHLFVTLEPIELKVMYTVADFLSMEPLMQIVVTTIVKNHIKPLLLRHNTNDLQALFNTLADYDGTRLCHADKTQFKKEFAWVNDTV